MNGMLEQLHEMGFTDRVTALRALVRAHYDLSQTVVALSHA